MRQALAQAHENLDAVKEAARSQMDAHREAVAQLTRAHYERSALEESLVPLREEVDGRIKAREALIEEAVMLHHHVSDLREQKEAHTAELSGLEETHSDLRDTVARLKVEHGSLIAQIEALRQTVTHHAGESDRLQRGLNELDAEIADRHAEQLRLQQLLAEEQTRVGNFLAAKGNLEKSIVEAGDSECAVEAIQKAAKPFDLILLDLTLGETNGVELIPQFRQKSPSTPILVISGLDVEEAEGTGANGFLGKPFTKASFGNAFADWMGVLITVIMTKHLYEKGSAESKQPRAKMQSPTLEFLREHSLTLFLVTTWLVWIAVFRRMDPNSRWGQVVGNIVSEWTQILGLVWMTKSLMEVGSKGRAR